MAKNKLEKGGIRSLFCRQAGVPIPTVYQVDKRLRVTSAFHGDKVLAIDNMPSSVLEWFPSFRRDEVEKALTDVLNGKRKKYRLYLPCPSYTESRWVSLECVRREENGLWLITFDATQQKMEIVHLQTTAAQYTALVNYAPFAIYITLPDASLTPLFVSPRINDLIGYKPEEVYNAPDLLVQAIHPDDWPRVSQEIRNARTKGTSYVLEYRLLDRWGNERYVLDQGVPVKDSLGQVMAIEGILLDTTERMSLKETLKEMETKHRAVIEQAGDAILILSPSGGILEANPRAVETFGLSREDGGVSQMPPMLIVTWNNILRSLLKEREVTPTVVSLPRSDGSLVTVEVNVRRIELGRESAILVIARDVGERLKKEAEMREHTRLLSLVKEAIIRLDNDGKVLYWNKGAEKLYAINEQAALGRPFLEIVPSSSADDGRPLTWKRMWPSVSRGGQLQVVQIVDGNRRYVTLSVAPVLAGDGASFGGAVVIAWDVTREVMQKARLRSMEQVVQNMEGYAFTLGANGVIFFANQAAAHAWRAASPEDLVGRHVSTLFEGMLFPFKSAESLAITVQRGHWSSEVVARTLDGSTFPVRLDLAVVHGGESSPVGLAAVAYDISDATQVVNALKSENRLLQVLHDLALRLIAAESTSEAGKLVLDELALWYDMDAGVMLWNETEGWQPVYVWGDKGKAKDLESMTLRLSERYLERPGVLTSDAVGDSLGAEFPAGHVMLLPVRLPHDGPLEGILALGGERRGGRPPAEEFLVAVARLLSASLGSLKEREAVKKGVSPEHAVLPSPLETRYKAVVENAPVGIMLFDQSGRIIDHNRMACSLLGCQGGSLKGEYFHEMAGISGEEQDLRGLWQTKSVSNVEVRTAAGEGDRLLAGTFAPIVDYSGKIVGYQWAFRDVTQERMLERQVNEVRMRLEAEREKLNQAIAKIAEGILILDEKGNVVLLNPSLEALSGTSASDVIGKHVVELAGRSLIWKAAVEMWLQGREVLEKHVTVPGSVLPEETQTYQIRATKIYNPNGELEGAVISFRDISRLTQIERLKAQFVSSISHELRTPLHAIRLFLYNLVQNYDTLPDAKKKQFIRIVSEQVNTLHYLIEQLLILSRLDAGRLKPYRIKSDLRDVTSRVMSEMAQLAREKNIHLVIQLPRSRPVFAVIDEQQVSQVLRNLADNAIKYTPSGGRVTVRVKRSAKGHAVVEVSDTGPGIPHQDMERLFERFYRGEADNGSVPGTGLGLAIAKELVLLNRGDIQVESEVGKGSTFIVTFPASDQDEGRGEL